VILVAKSAVGTGSKKSIADFIFVDDSVTAFGAATVAIGDEARSARGTVGGAEFVRVARFTFVQKSVTAQETTAETGRVTNGTRLAILSAIFIELPIASLSSFQI